MAEQTNYITVKHRWIKTSKTPENKEEIQTKRVKNIEK